MSTAAKTIEALIEEGLRHYGLGKKAAAREVWEEAQKRDPSNAQVQEYLSYLGEQSGSVPTAVPFDLENDLESAAAPLHTSSVDDGMDWGELIGGAMPQTVIIEGGSENAVESVAELREEPVINLNLEDEIPASISPEFGNSLIAHDDKEPDPKPQSVNDPDEMSFTYSSKPREAIVVPGPEDAPVRPSSEKQTKNQNFVEVVHAGSSNDAGQYGAVAAMPKSEPSTSPFEKVEPALPTGVNPMASASDSMSSFGDFSEDVEGFDSPILHDDSSPFGSTDSFGDFSEDVEDLAPPSVDDDPFSIPGKIPPPSGAHPLGPMPSPSGGFAIDFSDAEESDGGSLEMQKAPEGDFSVRFDEKLTAVQDADRVETDVPDVALESDIESEIEVLEDIVEEVKVATKVGPPGPPPPTGEFTLEPPPRPNVPDTGPFAMEVVTEEAEKGKEEAQSGGFSIDVIDEESTLPPDALQTHDDADERVEASIDLGPLDVPDFSAAAQTSLLDGEVVDWVDQLAGKVAQDESEYSVDDIAEVDIDFDDGEGTIDIEGEIEVVSQEESAVFDAAQAAAHDALDSLLADPRSAVAGKTPNGTMIPEDSIDDAEAINPWDALSGESDALDLDQAPRSLSMFDELLAQGQGVEIDEISEDEIEIEAVGSAPDDDSLEDLMSGAMELFNLGDFTGSLALVEKVLEADPDSVAATEYFERNEKTLIGIYESKLGDLGHCPTLMTAPDEIIWMNLHHRAGFLLSQVDGSISYEDLAEVSGMTRLETYRILSDLVQNRVIK